MAVPSQDPREQAEQFGFSYPPLPPRGIDPVLDRALDMVAEGTSPSLIRELDSWTGAQHAAYDIYQPGSGDTGNRNIWLVRDGEYVWIDSDGQVSSPPSWAPPKPDIDLETGQYSISRPVSVIYPTGQQPVVIEKPQYAPSGYNIAPGAATFNPNTGTWQSNAIPQTDSKVGVTNTTSPAGSQVKPATVANVTGALTLDEQVQASALAGTGRTDLGWDEWGYYYKQIYGEAAPAPEDRGYARAADGFVYIAGRGKYPFETWKDAAFGAGVGPGGIPGDTGGAGGAGGEGPGGDGGGNGKAEKENWAMAILAGLVGGDKAFSLYSGWPEQKA